ncbi:helix-turn-helix domain-containing protein [Streptosporangium carneum]|uniref:AraC family transcriptional regulator n=1 Tax=Streptosporangium carneum TaxID=47481 RepID=A0A9W6I8A7_9ACTN|nr:helix-turn-helix domain-containing protein [Streptosporangium carneum]GLK13935.1 AraC family transcriptional regulator [Streptosporangium carneum]
MIETVFRSQDMPAADRFAWWHEMTTQSLVPTLMRSDNEAEFPASLRLVDLGLARLTQLSYPPLRSRRTPLLIRRSDPEIYSLSLTLRGTMALDHCGRHAVATPQDLLLYDSSHPFHARTTTGGTDNVEGIILQIPRALLPLPTDKLTRLTATRLTAAQGISVLLASHLTALARHAADYAPADAARLSAITVDLFAAVCAHHLEVEAALPPETHRQVLQTRIHAFIQQHLGDPGLRADTIAASHQISVRYLYRLFEDQGLSVASWIRQRRLERCRRDLADSALHLRPIHAIATRWGFPNAAQFSRAFRATYGISPTDYRHLIRRDGAVHELPMTMQSKPTTS